MATTDTDDLFTYNTTTAAPGLAEARAEAPCHCMTCWGEFPITFCQISPLNTLDNIRMLR